MDRSFDETLQKSKESDALLKDIDSGKKLTNVDKKAVEECFKCMVTYIKEARGCDRFALAFRFRNYNQNFAGALELLERGEEPSISVEKHSPWRLWSKISM